MTIELDDARQASAELSARVAAQRRALWRSEYVRDRAARALEDDLRPMRVDEDERARRREAHARADAIVAEHRHVLQAVLAVQHATNILLAACESAGALDEGQSAVALRLAGMVTALQKPRDSVTSAPAPRAAGPVEPHGSAALASAPRPARSRGVRREAAPARSARAV